MSLRPLGAALALLAFPAGAAAFEKMHGLDTREAKIEWKLGRPSQGRPGEQATRTCEVYPRHAVLWSEEGIMGVVDLEVRSRPRGMAPRDVCGSGFSGKTARPVEDGTLSPVGIFEHYLVAVFPDGAGVLGNFTVFDLDTGKKVFSDEYAYGREVLFQDGKDGPTLTYWSALRGFDCVPRRGDEACWKRVREKVGIPVYVQQPDCEKAVAKEPSALQGRPDLSIQITLHVLVSRLSRGDAVYLPDRPSCDLTP